MCHGGGTEVERTPNKSQHTKLTLDEKILPPLLPGYEVATFRSRVRRSNQQAIPAPPSENTRSQSSQLPEPLWTDPGLKSGISVHELVKVS